MKMKAINYAQIHQMVSTTINRPLLHGISQRKKSAPLSWYSETKNQLKLLIWKYFITTVLILKELVRLTPTTVHVKRAEPPHITSLFKIIKSFTPFSFILFYLTSRENTDIIRLFDLRSRVLIRVQRKYRPGGNSNVGDSKLVTDLGGKRRKTKLHCFTRNP